MRNITIRPVILCGGAGIRLWPMSRRDHPKQFLAFGDHRSLLVQAIERAELIEGAQRPVLVAGEAHRFFAKAALEETGHGTGRILLEPVARNTAAAIAAAAVDIAGEAEDAILAVMPSDHFIRDGAQFATVLSQAARLAAANEIIALIGVRPLSPHTGYGYIAPGEEIGEGAYAVSTFREKPDLNTARELVDKGYFWNAGVFVATARTLIRAFRQHAPDILDQAQRAVETAERDQNFLRLNQKAYEACQAQSIDYAVMEAFADRAVLSFDGMWSDLGSWDAVGELFDPDENGNRISGDALTFDSRETLVISENRLAVTIGVDNLVVIDTRDTVLIAARDQLDQIRDVVQLLKKKKRTETQTPVRVERPWGSYEILSQGPGYQMKRIIVKPGGKLSLQYHRHRSEHWVVVEGEAEVTRDGEIFRLTSNESTFIPLGATHRLHNPHDTPLTIIEIQLGSYLGEDDIVRVEDIYGRRDGDGEKSEALVQIVEA